MARVLLNPAAGGARASRWVRRLRSSGPGSRLDIRVPDSPDDMRREASDAVAERARRLVVAGGDGTIHQVLPALSGTDCALGIVPIGSCNDLARSIGLPVDPDRSLEIALEGPTARVDLGEACGRPFAGVGGVGFDGEVAGRVRRLPGWLRGPLAYPTAACWTLLSYRPPRVVIEHDTGRFDGRVLFAVLANAPRFGGGMRIAPDASLRDGRFDLVIVREVGRLRLVRSVPTVYSGSHVRLPEVEVVRTRRAIVRSDRPVPVFADGEPIATAGADPVEFRIRPAALTVVVPSEPPVSVREPTARSSSLDEAG